VIAVSSCVVPRGRDGKKRLRRRMDCILPETAKSLSGASN
jgi:hypothetical protein